MDDNQYSDAAYEADAQLRLKKITKDILIVGGIFLAYCAGFVSALIVIR